MTTPTTPLAPAPPPAPARSRWSRHKGWIIPTLTGLLGFALASSAGSSASTTTASAAAPTVTVTSKPVVATTQVTVPAVAQTTTVTVTDQAAAEPAPPPAPDGITDGTYVVGTDIKPGTYHSKGGAFCYWARLSSDSEQDIIDNHAGAGPTNVTIKRGDHAFTTNGCDPWVRR